MRKRDGDRVARTRYREKISMQRQLPMIELCRQPELAGAAGRLAAYGVTFLAPSAKAAAR